MERRVLLLLLGAVVSLIARDAIAWPFLPARPIPNAIAGPADPHPTATFYNPAALGPLRGVHLWWDAGARVQLGTIARDAGPAAQAGQSTPIVGPGVDGFFGVTWDFFSDRVTAGVAVTSPFNDLTAFSPGAATRYQSIWSRAGTLEEIVAVGVRISNRFFIGAGATFTETWLDYRFARDTAPAGGTAGIDQPSALCGGAPCGLENPLATQDVRVRGFGWGAGLSAGVLARPVDRIWLALSYLSHPLAPYRGAEADRGASVTAAPGSPDPNCGGACVGRTSVDAVVPDILTFAIRIEATPRLEIEGTTRWVHYGQRNALTFYLQGGTLDRIAAADPAGAVPVQLKMDRGFQDAWALGTSFRVRLGDHVRLSPSLVYESSAVDSSLLSAATLDAHKLDLALTLEWHPREHLTVGAHLGGVAYLVGQAGEAYEPRAQATCVDAAYALSACEASIAGRALPSAAARYTMGAIHGGFALGMDY